MAIDEGSGGEVLDMLVDMLNGDRETIRHECPSCQGAGKVKSTNGWKCQECKGKGWDFDDDDEEIICHACNGDQVIYEKKCKKCRGSGYVVSIVECSEQNYECGACDGQGTVEKEQPCPECYQEIPPIMPCDTPGSKEDEENLGGWDTSILDEMLGSEPRDDKEIDEREDNGICNTCNNGYVIKIKESCEECRGTGNIKVKMLMEVKKGDLVESDWLSPYKIENS